MVKHSVNFYVIKIIIGEIFVYRKYEGECENKFLLAYVDRGKYEI